MLPSLSVNDLATFTTLHLTGWFCKLYDPVILDGLGTSSFNRPPFFSSLSPTTLLVKPRSRVKQYVEELKFEPEAGALSFFCLSVPSILGLEDKIWGNLPPLYQQAFSPGNPKHLTWLCQLPICSNFWWIAQCLLWMTKKGFSLFLLIIQAL